MAIISISFNDTGNAYIHNNTMYIFSFIIKLYRYWRYEIAGDITRYFHFDDSFLTCI